MPPQPHEIDAPPAPANGARNVARDADESFEADAHFAEVVAALCAASERELEGRRRQRLRHPLPSRGMIEGIVEDLRAVLFPWHFGIPDLRGGALRHFVRTRLDRAQVELTEQVRSALAFVCDHAERDSAHCRSCDQRSVEVAQAVVWGLPRLRALLESDALAAYEGDPAARFLDETLFCYPGVQAITQHRIAHELYALSVPLIPRIIAELSHSVTGIDIHPGASIGASFFIDHGTGVVIGETCKIGERVRIYQGVTLGARGFVNDPQGRPIKSLPRHPIVEDDVVIYAGATILGRITIGRGARIGGNVWLTRDVAPGSHVSQALHRQQAFRDGSGI